MPVTSETETGSFEFQKAYAMGFFFIILRKGHDIWLLFCESALQGSHEMQNRNTIMFLKVYGLDYLISFYGVSEVF